MNHIGLTSRTKLPIKYAKLKVTVTNLVPRAFLRRGEDGGGFPAHPLLGGEKPWERG